jgi:hypothetical protein
MTFTITPAFNIAHSSGSKSIVGSSASLNAAPTTTEVPRVGTDPGGKKTKRIYLTKNAQNPQHKAE